MNIKTSGHLQKILSLLPHTPGVYKMKDSDGKVIYVGKAKDLFQRVHSYFLRYHDLSPAKKQMVHQISDIETILCDTEVEALILETSFIKYLSPKYNILMKDDKNLSYICITNEPVQGLIKSRKRPSWNGEYYGPYVSSVEEIVRLLRRVFHIRNCKVRFDKKINPNGEMIIIADKAGKTIPCMDYYIGICPGPCKLQNSNIQEHALNIEKARDFLSGKDDEIISRLHHQMLSFSEKMEFEKAQEIKEGIEALKKIAEGQKVRDYLPGNIDVCVMYEKYEKNYIGFCMIRDGILKDIIRSEVEIGSEDISDAIPHFLIQRYLISEDIPDEIIFDSRMSLSDSFFSYLSGKGVQITFPSIGPKKNILDFMRNQIRDFAYKKHISTLENTTLGRTDMANILEAIGIPIPDGDIIFECYDISHTDGHFTYASRVVMINGKPANKLYKRYKIKSLFDGMIDDYASHKEVMYRRGLEGIEIQNFPHLIIIDGGKGQLTSALSGLQQSFDQYGYSETMVPICSLAKREEEVFVPERNIPHIFEPGSPELRVFQKIRDESHRFSLSSNISARMKSMKKNILEQIPGIGPVTRKKILKIAGSVENISQIDINDLEIICTKKQMQVLRDHGIL